MLRGQSNGGCSMLFHGIAPSMKRVAAGIAACTASLALTACTELRLLQDFEAEPFNAAPTPKPLPNPPNDDLTWNKQFVTTVVVPLDGHRWSRTRVGGYLGQRENASALLAITEPFAYSGKGVRGSFKLRLIGTGADVRIALRSVQTDRFDGTYLGGYSITNHDPGGISGVGRLGGGTLSSAIEGNSWVAWNDLGTGVKSYSSQGQTIQLNWSIDQQNRILVLGADGGQGSVTYSANTANGISNTPLKRIWIQIFVRNFHSGSELLIDDLRVEEFK
jgi:hypothetical protein